MSRIVCEYHCFEIFILYHVYDVDPLDLLRHYQDVFYIFNATSVEIIAVDKS